MDSPLTHVGPSAISRGELGTDRYVVAAARAGVQISRGLDLRLGVHNLGDVACTNP